jgi:hypothetical protein
MSVRTPTQEAKGIAAAQLWAYLQAGQPFEDCGCCESLDDQGCARCVRVAKAIEKLAERMLSQSGAAS